MTHRQLQETTLVVASHNPGKVREIAELVRGRGVGVVSAGELGLDEPEETGATFAENALLKARAAADASGKVALADDSGLAVEALGGAPGIYSARWAGPQKDFSQAMQRVEHELSEIGAVSADARAARFVCALCIAWPDGHHEIFEGEVRGHLVWPPRGEHGFGYDPVFVATGRQLTFGEMAPEEKHEMSHRADAFAKLTEDCLGHD